MALPILVEDTPKRGRSADDIGGDQRAAKRIKYVPSLCAPLLIEGRAKLTVSLVVTSKTSTTSSLSSLVPTSNSS
jgi:hypothetical protein